MPGDMALVIAAVRRVCAVVWWFLSWFEVVLRLYEFFIPNFIQRLVRAVSQGTSRRWQNTMVRLAGSPQAEPIVVVFSYEASRRACFLLADLGTRPRDKVAFVYCEADVARVVPPAHAYMVFVDYNEHNVILELDAGGDRALHLSTVKALEQKAYGSVAVVYLDDRGPETVPENQLFNPHLDSAYAHPVLGVLGQQDRLFSVRQRWNERQRWVLRDWLSNVSTGDPADHTQAPRVRLKPPAGPGIKGHQT